MLRRIALGLGLVAALAIPTAIAIVLLFRRQLTHEGSRGLRCD